MHTVPNLVERRLNGSFITHYMLELFGNSIHFALANILLESLIDYQKNYFLSFDPYVLLFSSLIQGYFLTIYSTKSPFYRFLGNLIAPSLYIAIEFSIEGITFWNDLNHRFYPLFGFLIGLTQLLQGFTKRKSIKDLLIIIENIIRTGIIFLMYYIFETQTNPNQTENLTTFFSDTSHQFIGLSLLFFGVAIGLANATSQHYLGLLRDTTTKLKTFSEWLLGRELLNISLIQPELLHQQRQQRTIMFIDIRGFTQWSEAHSPEETVTLLSQYYCAVEDVLDRHRVIKWKISADEVMAIFAQPLEAVRAAAEIQQQITPLLAPEQLGAGIGLHCGQVVEGLLGSDTIKFYDVIGDTVNTTKRIESAAGKGEILISEPLYQYVKTIFASDLSRQLHVKGKAHPLTVYSLTETAPQPAVAVSVSA
ncbi:adenylate/guanylate cyclase domain-containing protein [Chloroflexus aggregans]|uniref:Adenylate/guanylate cyclase n=1 Tax=Chloroflexus aggregans (strain MD-66 / DSM 9485) TaxID=326427 RepID=B8G685_CHLAD|nr:adenylate/guanylate cyclase domain-containing protein [Chloroflexus aggregans]ACL25818.1 adenylate/guanylate cyclase [Chloroflexus aggregans DSM 9485]